jgi:DNA-binding CsgD family transcriptional regulator
MMGQEEGWAAAASIPDDAATPYERQQITRGQLNIGDAALLWGRYAEARRRLGKALDLAESHRYLRFRGGILATKLHLDLAVGAWDGLAERAGSLAGDEGLLPVSRLEAVLVAGLLDAAKGAHDQAGERLNLVLAEARRRGEVALAMEAAAPLAQCWLADGRTDDALWLTGELMGIVSRKGIWVWATSVAPVRADALIAAGRAGEAARLVMAFASGLRGRDAPAPRAALVLCRAILAEGRGEPARAASLFARAGMAWQALPRPHDALLARERQARCLLSGGQPDAGLGLLTETLHGLSRLGAVTAAARVARTLREHGVASPRTWRGGRRGYGDQLSPRELEVVRLVLTGRTNREIAAALFRSPKTVATQLNSAMRKLRVSTRTALAVSAIEAGIAPGGPHTAGVGRRAGGGS